MKIIATCFLPLVISDACSDDKPFETLNRTQVSWLLAQCSTFRSHYLCHIFSHLHPAVLVMLAVINCSLEDQ